MSEFWSKMRYIHSKIIAKKSNDSGTNSISVLNNLGNATNHWEFDHPWFECDFHDSSHFSPSFSILSMQIFELRIKFNKNNGISSWLKKQSFLQTKWRSIFIHYFLCNYSFILCVSQFFSIIHQSLL